MSPTSGAGQGEDPATRGRKNRERERAKREAKRKAAAAAAAAAIGRSAEDPAFAGAKGEGGVGSRCGTGWEFPNRLGVHVLVSFSKNTCHHIPSHICKSSGHARVSQKWLPRTIWSHLERSLTSVCKEMGKIVADTMFPLTHGDRCGSTMLALSTTYYLHSRSRRGHRRAV